MIAETAVNPVTEPDFDPKAAFGKLAPESFIEQLAEATKIYLGARNTIVPLLPLALTLEGKPYTIADYFCMEPVFKACVPKRSLWKCGRQVSKSTTLSADAVLRSFLLPHLKTLCVTPRYQQIRLLSNTHIGPFIETSPVRDLMIGPHVERAVMERSFINGSMLYFSFAFLSVDRLRGYSVDKIIHDEVQDFDPTFLPVIRECTTASPLAIRQYSGTPKTIDNTIEGLWSESSQAEWTAKCDCGHWNMASAQADLLKMIGRKGVICSRCGQPLNVRVGHWRHTIPERAHRFPGYHIPQIILPLHNENADKWEELLAKKEGAGNYNEARFMNEVLGESCDVGIKLVSLTDLKTASTLPWPNDLNEAMKHQREYSIRALGIDWGGGGEELISTTAAAVVGYSPSKKTWDVLYGERIHTSIGMLEEVKILLRLARLFNIRWLAHDYGGAGSVREALMSQAGFDITQIIPFVYTGSTKNIVTHHPPTEASTRHYYALSKSASLVLTCAAIKQKMVQFPQYKSIENLLNDFIALYEDRTESARGADIYLVRRAASQMDDFAHAVNYACCALWHTESNFPNLAKKAVMKYDIPAEVLKEEEPAKPTLKEKKR